MKLLKFVEIQGVKYPINTDYRVALECDRILNDPNIDDLDRGILATGILFGSDSPYCQEALDKLGKYLAGGVDMSKEKNQKKIIDFEQHWDLVYSAFKGQYGIDLHKEDLHYFEFTMLLKGLRKQALTDVIELMTYDLSQEKDHKRKKEIIEAQKAYEIKSKEIVREVEQHDFISQLSEETKGG